MMEPKLSRRLANCKNELMDVKGYDWWNNFLPRAEEARAFEDLSEEEQQAILNAEGLKGKKLYQPSSSNT